MVFYAIFYVILVVACFIAEWYVLGISLILFLVVGVLFLDFSDRGTKKERTVHEQFKKKMKIDWEEWNRQKIPTYENARSELINKYGEPTKEFIFEEHIIDKQIIAFEDSNRIWILGNDFPMESILSCTLENKQKIKKGEITSTTTTKDGNMAKRAILGTVFLGGAGAIIGGSTAKKSTITIQGDDTILHSYTVIINVDSMTNPIIKIPVGRNGELANEIVGIMNVIINKNKKKERERV